MKKKLYAILFGVGGILTAHTNATAQVTLQQDYKNNFSPTIGTYQGINFRESGFSGMFYIPGTNGNEFWICSDRGVNIDCASANPSGCTPTYDKMYAFPSYSPKIFRVKLKGDSVQILRTISMKRPGGAGATGLLNPTGFGSTAAEVPSTDTVLDCANFAAKTAAKDVWGIDAEGIAVDRSGNFWICEEGGPTIWKLNPNGVVTKRYSPYATLPGADPLDAAIDTCFRYRKNNRGFEGITIAPNGKIYAIIQSPLLYPTQSVGENTRVHRLLEIDPVTNAMRMLVYLNDGIVGASGSNQIRLRDWKIGDLAAISDTTFLVAEAALRGTTDIKRIYKINISAATAVNSGLYSGTTLEALVDSAGLAANSIVPVKKTLWVDLMASGWSATLEKAEGLAIVNDSTIYVCNDNDYGQSSAAANGIATATGIIGHVIKFGLSGSKKLAGYAQLGTTLSQGVTGVSTGSAPYLVPTTAGTIFQSLLTSNENVGPYKMCGVPDGLGAFDNGDGTFSLLMNHELNNTLGNTRAHGSTGAFVSKWIIKKSDLSIVSGSDLMQSVSLWNVATNSFVTYNAAFPSTLAALGRFCSADLPAVSAYYNSATGKGTMERIFMNGEENGNEGRAFGHIATGPNTGKSYELPYLGKYSWENAVASPKQSDTTVVIGMDDSSPLGQVYVYVGTKTTSGLEIEKAGLHNGRVFGISVAGMVSETSSVVPTPGSAFSLVDLGDVHNMTGTTLNTNSNTLGVTQFLRPEDGSWDPSNPNDFYFATTNAFNAPSRLWRLRFNNAANPQLGGTITAVLDGTEGQNMFDNFCFDNYGNVILLEDIGNQSPLGKIWQYKVSTDVLTQIGSHDSTRFVNTTTAANFLTTDEEASGIIDMESILGPGKFLLVDQAHYAIPGEAVEGGQLLQLFNPTTFNSAPEISVTGFSSTTVIVDGDITPSTSDNTDLGNINTGTSNTVNFSIKNSGAGALSLSGINFTGTDAAQYSLVGAPVFPATIATNATLTISVRLTPTSAGVKNATINIMSNDFDESTYNFALIGTGVETPEILIKGNGNNVIDGDVTAGAANNTDFGTVILGSSVSKTFVVENSGMGNLTISGINFIGTNAADFSITSAPTYPLTVPTSGSYTVTAKFTPAAAGTRSATMNVLSNDVDESTYDFAVTGNCTPPSTGIGAVNNLSSIKVFPNPTNGDATVTFDLVKGANITVSLMDMQGKEVISAIQKQMTAGYHSMELNTSVLQNGVYFLRVSDNNKTTNVKFVVMH